MARARNIKPAFYKNYELADLGPICQVLFSGLWCLADKEGKLEDKPRWIKAELFPYYEVDIENELNRLEKSGFILRYKVGELHVILVKNFNKHQSPHHSEKSSVLPDCDDVSHCFNKEHVIHGENTVELQLEDGRNLPDSLIPDSLNLIPDKGCPYQAIVDIYHEVLPMCPEVRLLTNKRKSYLKARWESDKNRQSLDYWRNFFEYVSGSDFLTGKVPPSNGRDKPFIADFEWLVTESNFAKVIERKYK